MNNFVIISLLLFGAFLISVPAQSQSLIVPKMYTVDEHILDPQAQEHMQKGVTGLLHIDADGNTRLFADFDAYFFNSSRRLLSIFYEGGESSEKYRDLNGCIVHLVIDNRNDPKWDIRKKSKRIYNVVNIIRVGPIYNEMKYGMGKEPTVCELTALKQLMLK